MLLQAARRRRGATRWSSAAARRCRSTRASGGPRRCRRRWARSGPSACAPCPPRPAPRRPSTGDPCLCTQQPALQIHARPLTPCRLRVLCDTREFYTIRTVVCLCYRAVSSLAQGLTSNGGMFGSSSSLLSKLSGVGTISGWYGVTSMCLQLFRDVLTLAFHIHTYNIIIYRNLPLCRQVYFICNRVYE